MIDFYKLISPQKTLGRLLQSAFKLLPTRTVIPILQGPGRGLKWRIGSGNHGYWLGSYVVDVQRYMAEALETGNVYYDIGASAGFFSLIASRLVGDSGRVYSFEPNKVAIQDLQNHVYLNRLSNIEVIEGAVGSETGGLSLKEDGEYGTASRLSPGGDYEVQVSTLDDLVFSEGKRPPDLIKMNVEGAEVEVLAGAVRLLAKHGPRLIIFTHGETLKQNCESFLRELGYSCDAPRNSYSYILFADRAS